MKDENVETIQRRGKILSAVGYAKSRHARRAAALD